MHVSTAHTLADAWGMFKYKSTAHAEEATARQGDAKFLINSAGANIGMSGKMGSRRAALGNNRGRTERCSCACTGYMRH